MRQHDLLLDCRSFILDALVRQMDQRKGDDAWVENERLVVVDAANLWAQRHGIPRRVTVAEVEAIEVRAVGHVDYASKLALYVAEEVVYAPASNPQPAASSPAPDRTVEPGETT